MNNWTDIPTLVTRFVHCPYNSVSRRQKSDILKVITYERFCDYVTSFGYYLIDTGDQFVVIREKNLVIYGKPGPGALKLSA